MGLVRIADRNQSCLALSHYVSDRESSTQLIQALTQILGRTLRDFWPKLERHLMDVNRESHVVHTEFVIAVFIQVSEGIVLSATDMGIARSIYLRADPLRFQPTDGVQGIDRRLLPSDVAPSMSVSYFPCYQHLA